MNKLMLTIVILLSTIFSETIYVPQDYETIQEAIDASVDGDTIILEIGNHAENIVIDNKDILIGSKYLTTGEEFYIYTTRIVGNSDVGSTVTFKNNISNDGGLVGLTVNQNLIFGGC